MMTYNPSFFELLLRSLSLFLFAGTGIACIRGLLSGWRALFPIPAMILLIAGPPTQLGLITVLLTTGWCAAWGIVWHLPDWPDSIRTPASWVLLAYGVMWSAFGHIHFTPDQGSPMLWAALAATPVISMSLLWWGRNIRVDEWLEEGSNRRKASVLTHFLALLSCFVGLLKVAHVPHVPGHAWHFGVPAVFLGAALFSRGVSSLPAGNWSQTWNRLTPLALPAILSTGGIVLERDCGGLLLALVPLLIGLWWVKERKLCWCTIALLLVGLDVIRLLRYERAGERTAAWLDGRAGLIDQVQQARWAIANGGLLGFAESTNGRIPQLPLPHSDSAVAALGAVLGGFATTLYICSLSIACYLLLARSTQRTASSFLGITAASMVLIDLAVVAGWPISKAPLIGIGAPGAFGFMLSVVPLFLFSIGSLATMRQVPLSPGRNLATVLPSTLAIFLVAPYLLISTVSRNSVRGQLVPNFADDSLARRAIDEKWLEVQNNEIMVNSDRMPPHSEKLAARLDKLVSEGQIAITSHQGRSLIQPKKFPPLSNPDPFGKALAIVNNP